MNGGQGQSVLTTEAKIRGLSYAMAINMRIFLNKFGASRFRYWYFDLNAGCGFNHDIGCIGSPLTFLAEAQRQGVERYFAGFCDHDEIAVRELMACPEVRGNPRAHVFHGDNAEYVDAIPYLIGRHERPNFAIGTVLSDDNGSGIPVDKLAALSRSAPRLDIVIHWNSTGIKRAHGRRIFLAETMAAIGKKHWWIREPVGKFGFTMLVGQGICISPSSLTTGFHKIESLRGQSLLERCGYTHEEQKARGPQQGGLW